jgi:pyruvate,water dikinase
METKKKPFILWFDQIRLESMPLVGGKNAGIGEMYSNLVPLGIKVPNGFAITAEAYNHFLNHNKLKKEIHQILHSLDARRLFELRRAGKKIRNLILAGDFPEDLRRVIEEAYSHLGLAYFPNPDVAVRSSATAEDLPGASFAGAQESYLNVKGVAGLLQAIKKSFASLFTDRAISYRADKGFGQESISLSVGVQKMVRSDLGSSGVVFTIHTETGFDKVIVINSSYGLGEMVVQGKVIPDEFMVFKPTLEQGFRLPLVRNLGEKKLKLIYDESGTGTKTVMIPPAEQVKFSLDDNEVMNLAGWCLKIEKHFSEKYNHFQPMDIEWAKDGESGELFIVQARPETVHSIAKKRVYKEYRLAEKGELLLEGLAVGTSIVAGKVRVIKDARRLADFKEGEILVTTITNPDWEPIMKIASAIVADKGGRTSHAAIVSRELGIPCIVGSGKATQVLKTGEEVTVDCSSGTTGRVWRGRLRFEVITHELDKIPETKTSVMVNIGSPEEAFKNHYLPVKGVGLGRLEFIIASHIRVHPKALLDYPELKKSGRREIKALVKKIEGRTAGYDDKQQYYIDKLTEGIGKIAASFWPQPVIIRFSDFKTNEYRSLLGGELYEPAEENPMIGWRGASRYYDPKFETAFGLECLALKKVRDILGLKNVIPMVPFCRTPEEGRRVLEIMQKYGLTRGQDGLKVYVMCEVPSNILLAQEFLEIFDGMSIGSNDLTQLVLGIDRDSGLLANIADESNPAVLKMIGEVIDICTSRGKYIGICGQAPSDLPGFVEFLVKKRIGSLSLNPDTVIKTILKISELEQAL